MVLKNAHLWPRLQVADAGLQLGRAFCPLPSSADYQSNGGSAERLCENSAIFLNLIYFSEIESGICDDTIYRRGSP